MPVNGGGCALFVQWVAEYSQALCAGRLGGVVYIVALKVFLYSCMCV